MTASYQIKPTSETLQTIRDYLANTYWDQDCWYIQDEFFNEYRLSKPDVLRTLQFSLFSPAIRNEIKYFYAIRIERRLHLRLRTIFSYGVTHQQLAAFLNKYYPKIRSITDLPGEKAIKLYKMHLIQKGLKVSVNNHIYYSLLSQLIDFFIHYYDNRNEFDKDVWDCRKIPGVRITENTSEYLISFSGIPLQYRSLVKRYLKVRLSTIGRTTGTHEMLSLQLFTSCIANIHSEWSDLSDLERADIEVFLSRNRQHNSDSLKLQWRYITHIRAFLEYIQRAEYCEAPKRPSAQLIWKEDLPRLPKKSPIDIGLIPDGVLRQLEDNLEYISPPEYIPIVIVLRASGWRISDVLNLRYDTCIEHARQGWWLCGDIPKTGVLNHRVPITDEVAAVIQAVINDTISKSTDENNSKHYLFVRFDGKRMGRPPCGSDVQRALNRLAKNRNIIDDDVKMFHFKNHAFRHTKGIELINNGMSLLHVQKWMAHASPEMTLTYAKILDTTMRKSWEEAVKNGVFRLDSTGKPIKVNLSELENEDQIEWEYIRSNLDAVKIPLGYCFKSKKVDCRQQLNPCLVCSSFCTVPEFLPQFEMEMAEVRQVIDRAIAQGQSVWVEKNQALLERYQAIVNVLEEGKIHHRAGKAGREYVEEERNNAK